MKRVLLSSVNPLLVRLLTSGLFAVIPKSVCNNFWKLSPPYHGIMCLSKTFFTTCSIVNRFCQGFNCDRLVSRPGRVVYFQIPNTTKTGDKHRPLKVVRLEEGVLLSIVKPIFALSIATIKQLEINKLWLIY